MTLKTTPVGTLSPIFSSRVPHPRRSLIAARVGIERSSTFPQLSRAQNILVWPAVLLAGLLPAEIPAQEPVAAPGKVIFSTDSPSAAPSTAPNVFPKEPVTNDERTAVVIVSDDLDLHLTPTESREEGHAILVLRNASAKPLARIPLQLTSTLRWIAIGSVAKGAGVTFTQSPVTTDADHTGYAQEAVLTPGQPLAPGAALTVSVFFSGQIPQSTDRLTLIGTPQAKAVETDWDAIIPTADESATALRGFGDVLWYPVAAPTALFSEGNALFTAVAHQRLLNASATMRLQLTILYSGEPPDGVVFDGQLQPLIRLPDNSNQVIDDTQGVATAEFPMTPIGFRTPNLFLTAERPADSDSTLLSVITPVPGAVEPYAQAAQAVAALLTEWIAPTPLTPLTLLEHPGQPFEDHAFIAAHLTATAQPDSIAPAIVRGLTHAFFRASSPTSTWLDQGLAEFMSLLWIERTSGRPAAVAQLQQNALALLLAEPDLATDPKLSGTPLTEADTDVFLRFKAAAVLWQLRDIVGQDLLRQSIANYRHSLELNPKLDRDPEAFEKSLEKTCARDLHWFFDDWVDHDRSLPDLSIASVDPRPILTKAGVSGGYLVAVDVRNDGYAAAEVPVTIRAGDVSATARVRVGGRSTGSVRIVFEGIPETVQVNDGTVPELRASTHTEHFVL